jgi:RNA-directed DNA polymerase
MFEVDVETLASASHMKSADVLVRWGEMLLVEGLGYTRIAVPQKRRRPREVLRPNVGLDRVLKHLRLGLASTSGYEAPDEVHGFVQGRGTVTNAACHLGRDVVLKVDIRDFFDSIGSEEVCSGLVRFGFTDECAELVASVTLVDGKLAQGFSTSPLLSNMAFLRTDEALAAFAQNRGVTFTRYVDDLAFSGIKDSIDDDFLESLEVQLGTLGWSINPTKTRFMRRGGPQFVTGLYVGDHAGAHIPRPMKERLRRELYFAERFGVSDARQKSPKPMSIVRLAGWVHYAAHADPAFGLPLRDRWRRIAPALDSYVPGPDWDLLEDIEFPDDW